MQFAATVFFPAVLYAQFFFCQHQTTLVSNRAAYSDFLAATGANIFQCFFFIFLILVLLGIHIVLPVL